MPRPSQAMGGSPKLVIPFGEVSIRNSIGVYIGVPLFIWETTYVLVDPMLSADILGLGAIGLGLHGAPKSLNPGIPHWVRGCSLAKSTSSGSSASFLC